MLATELHTHTIPDLFSQFERVIGQKHWVHRVQACKAEIRGNPFLVNHLRTENDIAFQLDHLSKLAKQNGGAVPLTVCNDHQIFPAVIFLAQVISFIRALPKEDGERFCRRVHGAFRNPNDMRGLRLEMAIATHFLRLGKRVVWPEIAGAGTFDLLISDVTTHGLEVECKSISGDKGLKVHHREALDFLNLLKPYIQSSMSALSNGVYAVLTIPARLPTLYKDRRELARDFGTAIFAGKGKTLADGSSVRIGDFDASLFRDGMAAQEVRMLFDSITETRNRELTVFRTRGGGRLAVAIQSALDDELLKTTFDTLSQAARSQLSGRRAGMVIAEFFALDSGQLRALAKQDEDPKLPPTSLRMEVSRFLSSARRSHLVGAGFVSHGQVRPMKPGLAGSEGATYYFPREESEYWSDDLHGLFEWVDNIQTPNALVRPGYVAMPK